MLNQHVAQIVVIVYLALVFVWRLNAAWKDLGAETKREHPVAAMIGAIITFVIWYGATFYILACSGAFVGLIQ